MICPATTNQMPQLSLAQGGFAPIYLYRKRLVRAIGSRQWTEEQLDGLIVELSIVHHAIGQHERGRMHKRSINRGFRLYGGAK